jgi:hypothetical protein
MYHDQNGSVIETNDIKALRYSEIQTLPDGTVVARLALELVPGKDYSPHPSFHITDGVEPRLLIPTPAPASPEPPESPEDKSSKKEKK